MKEAMEGRVWYSGHISEDTLTEHIFSALHYVPSALRRFIETIREINRLDDGFAAGPLESLQVFPGPSWEIPEGLRKLIAKIRGKERKGSAHPDALVTGPGWTLVVESEDSKAVEPDQMVEQILLAPRVDWEHRGACHYHLLLNNTLWRPGRLAVDIQACCRGASPEFRALVPEADTDPLKIAGAILWCSWAHVRACFERCLAEDPLHRSEKMILIDRIALFERRGIRLPHPPGEDLHEARRAAKGIEYLCAAIGEGSHGVPHGSLRRAATLASTILDLSARIRNNIECGGKR